jgi:serine/threonine protein kinase
MSYQPKSIHGRRDFFAPRSACILRPGVVYCVLTNAQESPEFLSNGTAMIESASLIGQELGSVTLVKELGRGTMGIVLLGFQKTLKRQVAVKILPKSDIQSKDDRDGFGDEAEILASINHPNIIPIFETGETDLFFYQVIQLIDGGTLEDLLTRTLKHPVPSRRMLPLPRTFEIITQVLDGLACAHADKIIHQDIKPANILIDTRTQRPLIADFGIARTAKAQYRLNGKFLGSPMYCAPEQITSDDIDHRIDIYSIGMVLLEMTAGTLPVVAENAKSFLTRKLRAPDSVFTLRPSQASNRIDDALEKIILTAIASKPDDRYADCGAFKTDLLTYQNRLTVPEPT